MFIITFTLQVLPRLSACLHDVNETVRTAMVELLISVKSYKTIKFWTISSLEELLARLEIDKPFICRRIVKLLFNSYFPTNPEKSDSDKATVRLERCIHLVKANQAASRRFYQHSDKELELKDAVQFMLAVLKSVKNFVKMSVVANTDHDVTYSQELNDTDQSLVVGDNDKENSFGRRKRRIKGCLKQT